MVSQSDALLAEDRSSLGSSAAGGSAGDLPGFLYYHLYRAQNRIAQDFAEAIGPDDITPCQFNALCHIRTSPGLSQTQLSTAIGREKSTITPIIDRLERRGLVNRQASPSDRRTYALYLSPLGETTYQHMVDTATNHDQNMQGRLSANELETLVDLLQRVCDE
jgi:DNA-binding MarR family transcriptional regulator